MIDLVADKRAEIEALCEEYGAEKLWLFGSAATGVWDPERSDVDFIVDLGAYEQGVARRFLGLLVALERVLGVSVDLLTVRQVRSGWFCKEVESTRELLYDASRRSVVA